MSLIVIPIAATGLLPGFDSTPYTRNSATDAQELVEFAGRNCYQSWQRPNPATAANADYIAHIIRQGHLSVLEHASVTFYVEGVSRSLLTELTRHRHLSPSVLSQRYVDEHGRTAPVLPPLVEGNPLARSIITRAWSDAQDRYEEVVRVLDAENIPRKQVREAARSVLPQMTETRMVITGNHRAWREVIEKRNSPHADAEIHRFAHTLLTLLSGLAPAIYADMLNEEDD